MKKMKYISAKEQGTSEDFFLLEADIPEIGPNEVLIKIHFSGVNRPDILQREGKYLPPVDASPILGLEASGEIIKLGKSVHRWKIGDLVTALLHGGGYAEYAAVNQYHCLKIPIGLSMLEAASLCENYFTVWSNLFLRGNLSAGEKVLIHGGTSGIGLTAIQLATYFGAKVWTTAGTEEKCNFCSKMGAEAAVNYKKQDFLDFFLDRADQIKMDVILDMVGGNYIEKNIELLNEEGRLIFIAFLKGSVEKVNFSRVMIKRLKLFGSTLRPQSINAKSQIARSLEENVWPLLEQKKLVPVIDSVFDLADVSKAHRRMESSAHIGKIMLKVWD